MATQKVTEKILEDAKAESREILDKFKKEATKIKEEYAKRIAAKRSQIKKEVETISETEFLRTVSQKRLEFKKQVVSQKRKFIKILIEEALKGLMEQKEYLNFLKALIKKSGEKDGELIICKQDWQRHGADLEKFMKKEGLNYKVSTNNEIVGGIMIKREKMTYYGSLDLIRELLEDELTIVISQILF